MLTFFRRIRKGLLGEGATSKPASQAGRYLLYAIGEIVLVVIGILIALQINNWNEWRKDRNKEQVLLNQVLEDYILNLKQLDEKIEMRNQMVQFSIKLFKYIDGHEVPHQDSIMQSLVKFIYAPTFDPVNSALNSETINLLQNEELKNLLSSWPSDVDQLQEDEQAWRRFRDNLMIPFLIKEGVTRNSQDEFWKNNRVRIFLLDKRLDFEINMGKSKKSVNLDEFLRNPELEGYVANTITFNQSANLQSHAIRGRIEEILRLTEMEIDQE